MSQSEIAERRNIAAERPRAVRAGDGAGSHADAAPPIVSIRNLTKTYASGLQALKPIDLDIRKGEIFALLGPNGAGKTTLINIVCGIVTASTGEIIADGHRHRARLSRRAHADRSGARRN